jgi:DNA-binding response OmpR family regulator
MKRQLKDLRVLVVDDTAPMRDLLRNVLYAVGVGMVETARDGQEGGAIFLARPADIVFVDWEMEPTNGLALTRMLRAPAQSPNPYVPIIMMTSHAEADRVITARDAGIHEYLVKPITGDAVLTRLAEVINRPRAFVRTDTYFGPAPRRTAAAAGTA